MISVLILHIERALSDHLSLHNARHMFLTAHVDAQVSLPSSPVIAQNANEGFLLDGVGLHVFVEVHPPGSSEGAEFAVVEAALRVRTHVYHQVPSAKCETLVATPVTRFLLLRGHPCYQATPELLLGSPSNQACYACTVTMLPLLPGYSCCQATPFTMVILLPGHPCTVTWLLLPGYPCYQASYLFTVTRLLLLPGHTCNQVIPVTRIFLLTGNPCSVTW